MTKKQMLQKIKAILLETGQVSAGELQLDHDPIYGTLGTVIGLVEGYGPQNFGVVMYHNDIQIDTISVDYEMIEDVMDEFQIEYMLESLNSYKDSLDDN